MCVQTGQVKTVVSRLVHLMSVCYCDSQKAVNTLVWFWQVDWVTINQMQDNTMTAKTLDKINVLSWSVTKLPFDCFTFQKSSLAYWFLTLQNLVTTLQPQTLFFRDWNSSEIYVPWKPPYQNSAKNQEPEICILIFQWKWNTTKK